MSNSSGLSTITTLDHLHPSDHLCYVHCTRCDTVLAVSVPASSLFKAVTVRCGHCGSLLPLNLPARLLPAASSQINIAHSHNPFSSTTPPNILGEMTNQAPNYSVNQPNVAPSNTTPTSVRGGPSELPKPPAPTNRLPEKRQRVPSAYNRFIKDEIQRIKAGNPDISHREAFSAAAKNWAHFPHIHFGLMSDPLKRTSNIRPYHPQLG